MCYRLFLFFLLLSPALKANTWVQQSIGRAEDPKLAADPFGNIFMAGVHGGFPVSFDNYTFIGNNGNPRLFLARYGSSGNLTWCKNIEALGCSPSLGLGTDSLGNVYLASSIGSYTTLTVDTITIYNNSIYQNMFLTKIDSGGHVQWVKTTNAFGTVVPTDMVTDPGGNCYIAGGISSAELVFGQDTVGTYGACANNIFLAKYNTQGNALWGRAPSGDYWSTGSSFLADNAHVAIDPFGDVIMTGNIDQWYAIFGADTLRVFDGNMFIVKYHNDGSQVWTKQARGGHPSDIAVAGEDDICITGDFTSAAFTIGNDTLYNTTGSSLKRDIFLVRCNSNGNVKWLQQGGTTGDAYGGVLSPDQYGNVGLTCSLDSSITFSGFTFPILPGSVGPCLYVQYDDSGNLIDSLTLRSGVRGYILNKNNNLFLAGTSFIPSLTFPSGSVIAPANEYVVFITKLKEWQPPLAVSAGKKDDIFQVFPNPSDGRFTLRTSFPLGTSYFLRVYDANGHIVYSFQTKEAKCMFDLPADLKGWYMIECSDGTTKYTSKMLVEP
jgi:hypothetical protein